MFSSDKPTISDFLGAYKAAILGRKDALADVREGSTFELIGGIAAILWSREVQRDEDLFADGMTDTADGDALTDRLQAITDIARVLDSPGMGVAKLTRPTTAGGGGTFWEGTLIALVDRQGLTETVSVEVASDTVVDASVRFTSVPVRATVVGNAIIDVKSTDSVRPVFGDIVWDSSWVVERMTVDAGTLFEPAAQYRARVRQELLDRRVGFQPAIIAACKRAGASRVALFSADYGGDASDVGLNVVYVGDASYSTPPWLIPAVMLELESVRILGDNLQIRPMQSVALAIKTNVYLTDAPTKFNQSALIDRLQRAIVASVRQDFSYSLDGFRGAMFKASESVQDADFVVPITDATILLTSGPYQVFPATLNRYTLIPQDVVIKLLGPR